MTENEKKNVRKERKRKEKKGCRKGGIVGKRTYLRFREGDREGWGGDMWEVGRGTRRW